MKRLHVRLSAIAIALAVSLTLVAAPLQADIAPPEQPPGSNIQPAKATQVQMVAERVVIEVLRVKGAHDTSLPVANVVASFTMRNTGSAAETLTVRFPLSDPSGQGDGMGGHPEIEQVTITVNGKRTPTQIVTTPNPRSESESPIRWAAFDVTFPPGRDVVINVEYILQSTGYMPYGRFKYILETGAGWFGPIGLATIILRLPYEATPENVVLGTPGGQFSGNEVLWTFRDLEPTAQDNFYVTVLAPSVWERILQARRRVVAAPKSATAWRELAQAYLGAVFGKYGPEIGANFVPLIEDAYRRAQEADPTSAQLHAEWAQTLLNLYPPILELDPMILEKILVALQAAFERDPNNALARKVAADLRDWLERRANLADAGAETAKQILETLDQMASMDRSANATPTPAATAAEALPPASVPMTSSSFVTSVTATGVVVTSTVISTITTTLTDTTTAQPVVIVTVQESRTVTETADLAGTTPATVTEIIVTSVITTTGEVAITDSNVITATTVTTITKTSDQTGSLTEATPTAVVAALATPAPPTAAEPATGPATPALDAPAVPFPTPPESASPESTAWVALLLTLIIGGAAAYGIHKLTIRHDRARTTSDAERQEAPPEDSPTDRPSADL